MYSTLLFMWTLWNVNILIMWTCFFMRIRNMFAYSEIVKYDKRSLLVQDQKEQTQCSYLENVGIHGCYVPSLQICKQWTLFFVAMYVNREHIKMYPQNDLFSKTSSLFLDITLVLFNISRKLWCCQNPLWQTYIFPNVRVNIYHRDFTITIFSDFIKMFLQNK